MKVVAVYTAEVEVLVDLGEFETWEEAVADVVNRPRPPPPEGISMRLDKIWRGDDELELSDGHEVVGVCHLCGGGIADGCGFGGCKGKDHAERSGWVSTEHGHMVWCSEDCRAKDPDDLERGR